MATGVTFNLDRREFDRTLNKYRGVSKRTLPTICNTKALFIERRATIETPKADKAVIARELGEFITTWSSDRRGKRKALRLAQSSQSDAPLAALIVQAKRKRAGLPGLYGPAMEKAVRAFMASRVRSIAFLSSGWLGADKDLRPYADPRGGPPRAPGVKQYGQPKGSAIPAREGWKPTATIKNSAGDNKDNKGALLRYGGPALQRAFDAETVSMKEYMERKLKEGAHEAGIKTK